jgi:hypothetical protein
VNGYLNETNPLNKGGEVEELLKEVMRQISDSSGVAVKMATKALGKCAKGFSTFVFPESAFWMSKIVTQLLDLSKHHPYWLVKAEVKYFPLPFIFTPSIFFFFLSFNSSFPFPFFPFLSPSFSSFYSFLCCY